MGMKIFGVNETLKKLSRIHGRTHRRQLKALIQGGEKIASLASDNAPRKTGALEDAIISLPLRSGVRGRYEVFVGVDASKLGEGFQKYGFRYDQYLHENEFVPGPVSQAKIDSGKDVGSAFLTRALDELEDGIAREMSDIAREEALD